MGDRFILSLKCTYCNSINDNIWYAPTCTFYDFKCFSCHRTNFICADFSVKKAEDATEEDVVSAFEMASTVYHSTKAIRTEAKSFLRRLRKDVEKEKKAAEKINNK